MIECSAQAPTINANTTVNNTGTALVNSKVACANDIPGRFFKYRTGRWSPTCITGFVQHHFPRLTVPVVSLYSYTAQSNLFFFLCIDTIVPVVVTLFFWNIQDHQKLRSKHNIIAVNTNVSTILTSLIFCLYNDKNPPVCADWGIVLRWCTTFLCVLGIWLPILLPSSER